MRNLLPLIWRRISERYSLIGNHCENCGADYFPQRKLCPACRRKGKLVAKRMPREGKIISFTQVHAAPAGFELEAPYWLGLIELNNGVRVLSQIVDVNPALMRIDAPVVMVFRKIFEDDKHGAIAYGYKFKLAGQLKPTARKPVKQAVAVAKKGKQA